MLRQHHNENEPLSEFEMKSTSRAPKTCQKQLSVERSENVQQTPPQAQEKAPELESPRLEVQSSVSEETLPRPQEKATALEAPHSEAQSSMSEGDEDVALDEVMKFKGMQEKMKDVFVKMIHKEVEGMCKLNPPSSFRDSSLSALSSISFKQQATELTANAPTLLSALEAAAEPHRLERNVQKTKETLIPKIVTSASILLNCRNKNMNAHQVVNSLCLREGAAKKSTFQRLNRKGVCTSYHTALQKQLEYGENFDEEVVEWAKTVHECSSKERELQADVNWDVESTAAIHRDDIGYQLVMDNVDIVIQARHPTRDSYGKDLHMVQMIAVQHRVQGHHLSNTQAISSVTEVESGDFLPSIEENKMLRREWMILASRMIGEHIPALKDVMSTLPGVIHHDHMAEMKQKSRVVNLGVLIENENTSDGIFKIVKHMHQYTPGHGTDHPTRILVTGDLLTCERISSCIEEQRNSTSASQRFEGLMPVIADFHALANYYQVIWKTLYDPSSSADQGTLYAARNFLEARNVTSNPMKNINAAADVVEKFTVALVIAAALHYFGMSEVNGEPTKNIFRLEEHGDQKNYAETVMTGFVNTYMLTSSVDMRMEEQLFHCSVCEKKYVSRQGLLKHRRNVHHGVPTNKPDHDIPSNKPDHGVSVMQDGVLNYAKCALGMCMIALNFNDARQMGDGDRLIRLYKLMMLHCKVSNKPKYSFQMLRLLAQVKCFLTPRLAYELTWNRSVNTKGKAGCNVELDRTMEHQNRIFKEHCRGMRGKVTQKSVDRVSRSAQEAHKLLASLDTQMEVKKPSSKRQETKKPDVSSLAMALHQENIFEEIPGRNHSKFPDFPVSILSKLSLPDLHKWISSSLKVLSRQNQFRIC
ncbi:uncharacterized protein [Diadema setosum]|uniref:uncharacterized protein n=1 Tax=Diadema setosum TaxID=31175 RepID=UPI003B3A2FDC